MECVSAWEEKGDTCEVKHDMQCSDTKDTSDAICECGAPPPPPPLVREGLLECSSTCAARRRSHGVLVPDQWDPFGGGRNCGSKHCADFEVKVEVPAPKWDDWTNTKKKTTNPKCVTCPLQIPPDPFPVCDAKFTARKTGGERSCGLLEIQKGDNFQCCESNYDKTFQGLQNFWKQRHDICHC